MRDELPQGWAEVEVGAALNLVNGFAFKPSHWGKSGLPIIRIQNLNNPKASFNYCDQSMPEKVRVRKNDLLFAWSGTPGTSFGAHIWNGGDAWLNQHIFRMEFDSCLFDKSFLKHAINQNLNHYISQAHGGAGLAHITKGAFEVSTINIAPFTEQRRIVAKLDQLLPKVQECQERLEKISKILKSFRQSVLAAACSGRLTADWRERLPTQKLVPDDKNDLPEIPDSWRWVQLPETGEMNRGKSRHRPRNEPKLFGGSYPFIQTGDIAQSGGRIVSHKQTYSEVGLAQSRLWPPKTICITISANIAESALLTYPACFPDSVVGIIVNPGICLPEYVEFFIRVAKADLAMFAPATAQKNINIAILNEVSMPLPPLPEQHEIVRRVEALFKLADQIEARYQKAKANVDKLTQSILVKAFRGELVPQDPNDAPAEELLKRIRAKREKQESKKLPKKQAQRLSKTHTSEQEVANG